MFTSRNTSRRRTIATGACRGRTATVRRDPEPARLTRGWFAVDEGRRVQDQGSDYPVQRALPAGLATSESTYAWVPRRKMRKLFLIEMQSKAAGYKHNYTRIPMNAASVL